MTAPDPTWRGDDSFGWLRSLSQPHLDTAGVAPDRESWRESAERIRRFEESTAEDPIETSIEAAFGEIEELRRQRDDLETKLAENVGVMNALRRQRDTVEIDRDKLLEELKAADAEPTKVSCPDCTQWSVEGADAEEQLISHWALMHMRRVSWASGDDTATIWDTPTLQVAAPLAPTDTAPAEVAAADELTAHDQTIGTYDDDEDTA